MVDMYVSALDALRYLEPEWTDEKRFLKMASLPRAAIIKAFWPPTAQHRKLKDSCFDAVKFDNVQLLLECDGADAVANDFRQQAKEVALFPGSHPFLLVEDAALTASQKRVSYQRLKYSFNGWCLFSNSFTASAAPALVANTPT